MNRPQCCGRNTTPYFKVYKSNWWPSWETGFRCKTCNRIRIPHRDGPLNSSYMDAMEALRLAGIEFDKSLGIVYLIDL